MKSSTVFTFCLCGLQIFYTSSIFARSHFNTRLIKRSAARKVQKKSDISKWYVDVGGGYTNYKQMLNNEGQTPFIRVSIGRTFWSTENEKANIAIKTGFEAGVQTGNRMKPVIPQALLDPLGGLPIQSTMKTSIDLLGALKLYLPKKKKEFLLLKGGLSYRIWQFSRCSIDSKSRLSAEFQVGVGAIVKPQAEIYLAYQGIFGRKLHYSLNATSTGLIVNGFPTQHGIILGTNIYI